MSNRKVIAVLLSIMLCALLMVACGNPEAPAETQPTTEATQPQGTIKTDPFETVPGLDTPPEDPIPELDEEFPEPEWDPDPMEGMLPDEPTRNPQTEDPNQPAETAPTEPVVLEPPTTAPTDPNEVPEMDEDELPPVIAF